MKRLIALSIVLLTIGLVGWATAENYTGTMAGGSLGTGSTDNTAYGGYALHNMVTGKGNTAIGMYAGFRGYDYDGTIKLGYMAGYSDTTSHKLYINTGYYPSYGIFGILSSGYFGINKEVPTVALDVSGAITATGAITTSSTITGSGDMVVMGDTLTVSAEATVAYDAEADTSTVRITTTPNITLFGADGDNYAIGINTSDQALFSNAGGGYSFDGLIITTGDVEATRITSDDVILADSLAAVTVSATNVTGTRITGDDAVLADSLTADIIVVRNIHEENPHLFMGFSDSLVAITVTEDSTFYQITNATGDLFALNDSLRMTYIPGDTIQIDVDGDYYLNANISFTGNNGERWRLAFVDGENAVIDYPASRYTSNNDIGNITIQAYETLSAGDKITLGIGNWTDTDNPSVYSATFYIRHQNDNW